MPNRYASVASLLLSLALLQTGNGLFSSLLAVRLGLDPEVSARISGLVLSGYFVGLVLAARNKGLTVRAVGASHSHSRVAAPEGALAITDGWQGLVDVDHDVVGRGVGGRGFAHASSEGEQGGADNRERCDLTIAIHLVLSKLL